MKSEKCISEFYPKPVGYGETKPVCRDPNWIPSYIRPETIEVVEVGSQRFIIIGGKTGIDINI